jgi:hypothetical protein
MSVAEEGRAALLLLYSVGLPPLFVLEPSVDGHPLMA